MKNQPIRTLLATGVLLALITGGAWSASAQDWAAHRSAPVLLRLKYATFDPLVGEPDMPASLHQDAYPADGTGAYIVQFEGPIQEAWPQQLKSLGGRLVGYLPDYAYLVWMDGAARTRVEGLPAVRWVGLYQPAYKLSPSLDRSQLLHRVVLFPGADLAAAETRLASLDTPTTGITGEQFTLALPDGNIEAVAGWPEVLWIENQPRYRTTSDVAGNILHASTAWSSGYTGSGQMITVADTGVDSGVDGPGPDMYPDFDGRLAHIHSWPVQDDGCGGCCYTNIGADDGASDLNSGHGTHVLGLAGGNGAASDGQFKGLAYEAGLTFQALEQWVTYTPACGGGGGYEIAGIPGDVSQLFTQAYGWGSRVHSNSWGADAAGEYTADALAVDQFVWNKPTMVILFSAGNEGVDADGDGYVDLDSLNSPATAKNAITVGASENERLTGGYNPGGPCTTYDGCWPGDYPAEPTRNDRLSDEPGELAAFSSRGPTDDGRLKPDIVAPGTNLVSARSRYISGNGWGAHADSDYMYLGGSSMATPLVAGAAALVREYYVEERGHSNPSAALIKATLINSAVDISGYGNLNHEAGKPIPNNHEGWGRLDVGAATSGQRVFHDWDALTTGVSTTYYQQVGLGSTPLKVTLVWTDWPGSPPAGGLVNNLNLRVTAPGGTVYRGNQFSGGWSVPGGAADTVNNVESVYIQNPEVGQWSIRVSGANVPFGSQPFALVVTGWFGPTPDFDHASYLPLVSKGYGWGSGIKNGDFEAGPVAWAESSALGYDVIVDGGYLPTYVLPHSGSWAAWLGGADGETAYIEQRVTVSPAAPYLVYWRWIESNDTCGGADVAKVLAGGAAVETFDLCADTDTGGWQRHAVSLGSYAGQSVLLRIRVQTNGSSLSNLFVDDVSFGAYPLSEAASPGRSGGGSGPPTSPGEVEGKPRRGE